MKQDENSGWDETPPPKGEGQGQAAELSQNDQRMLDALVDVGFDLDALEELTDGEFARAEALLNTFGLLRDYPVDDADETLIHATLARIDRYEDAQVERLALANYEDAATAKGNRGFGIRKSDLIAVAAAFLLVASVVWPVMHSMRQRSIDLACANNLRLVGYAFGNYAADNHGAMPVAQATLGGTWDRVSNAVNLKPLLEGHYCTREHCRCPGNHDNLDMTYSYQWQSSNHRMSWGGPRITIAMGDRNPVMDAARAGRPVHHLAMSPDHRGRGQNALATDGATLWLDEPVVGQADNIWLPHGTTQLMPGAKPRDFWDVFLAH